MSVQPIEPGVTEARAVTSGEPAGTGSVPAGYLSPTIVTAEHQIPAVLAQILDGSPVVAVDTETTGLNPLRDRLLLLQLSNGRQSAVFDMTRLGAAGYKMLRTVLETADTLWLAQNAKFDYGWLAEKLQSEDILPRLFDTMVAEQILNGGAEHGGNSLARIAKRYLGYEMDKATRAEFVDMAPDPATGQFQFTDQQLRYSAIDVFVLPAIFAKQAKKLARANLNEVAKLEFSLIKVVSRMERRGVLIDRKLWTTEVDAAKERCSELEKEMKRLAANDSFNPRSPKQVIEAFRKLGFLLGSSNRGTLSKVRHPLAERMLEWRRVAVLRDRYGDSWLHRLDSGSRIHAQFVQLGAATGRFSSRDPNLQQLPRGDLLRKCFIAGPGRKMITADYAAIEMRVLAEYSGDEKMITLFKAGYDIHAGTAQQMFRLDELPGKNSKERQMAKSVNFGLVYGAGADNLRGQLAGQGIDVSKSEAEALIRLYFETFPQAKKWLDAQSKRAYAAMDDGIAVMTTTFSGRKRVFSTSHGMSSYERGHIARQCRNTPIQGASADITKNAMVLLDQTFREHPEWDAHLLMTVHDELVAECAEEHVDEVAKVMEAKMIEGGTRWMTQCPVKVDLVVADTWSK